MSDNTTPRDGERLERLFHEYESRATYVNSRLARAGNNEWPYSDIYYLLQQIKERDTALRDARRQIADAQASAAAEAEAFRDEQTANAELRRQIEEQAAIISSKYREIVAAFRQIEERDATIAEQARRLKEHRALLAEIADMEGRDDMTDTDFAEDVLELVTAALDDPRPTPATSGETPVPDDAFDDYIAGPDGWIRNSRAAPQPPTDLVERAREIISEWLEHDLSSWLDTELAELRELIIAALAAERAEGTRRGRERCAKIANEWLWADYDEAHEQLDFAIAARRVDAVLAAIEASGTHCIAPLEPTEDMWRAGVRTLANHQNSSAPLDEIMGLVYCAMLVARPRDVAPGEQSDAV